MVGSSEMVNTYGPGKAVDLPEIWVDIDPAIPCGLLANEVLANALKHGCDMSDSGTLRISRA
jgi:two-component sensor histidine kinase